MSEPKSIQTVDLVQQNGGLLVEQFTTAARMPVYAPVPPRLPERLRQLLQTEFPTGLYSHQARAIELGLEGLNVCLATPTASGKTVAFASIVLARLAGALDARAVVMYPAKHSWQIKKRSGRLWRRQ
jgi:DEAD/DEAH box helicase domain-containing protein